MLPQAPLPGRRKQSRWICGEFSIRGSCSCVIRAHALTTSTSTQLTAKLLIFVCIRKQGDERSGTQSMEQRTMEDDAQPRRHGARCDAMGVLMLQQGVDGSFATFYRAPEQRARPDASKKPSTASEERVGQGWGWPRVGGRSREQEDHPRCPLTSCLSLVAVGNLVLG